MVSSIKRIISLFAACVIAAGSALTAFASEPYDTYNYDRWADPIPSQSGYIADAAYSGKEIGCGTLKEPQDIFKSEKDEFYIVDMGNNRIVITDSNLKFIKELKEFKYNGETLTLKNPKGIFVTADETIYIADTENSRVLKCDKDGNVSQIFEKPVTELYSQERTFNPEKVIVDKAGNVYVVVKSITSGAVMFNRNGEFLGFYGANRVTATATVISNAFWNLISTETQRSRTIQNTPIGFSNFDIDDEGFIFTVTESQDADTDIVKKLNPAGYNILNDGNEYKFGDWGTTYYAAKVYKTMLTDIDIGDDGLINCLDFSTGRVFQYDRRCNLLFIFGASGNQLGTFISPTAVESMGENVYVVDSRKNTVTVFKRTDFGTVVHEAAELYNQGKYDEALDPWYQVLKMDGTYRRASVGIGNALLNNGEYELAMKYFKDADQRIGYNKAFEGYRDIILKENFNLIIISILVLIVVIFVIKRLHKKGIIKKFHIGKKGGEK